MAAADGGGYGRRAFGRLGATRQCTGNWQHYVVLSIAGTGLCPSWRRTEVYSILHSYGSAQRDPQPT